MDSMWFRKAYSIEWRNRKNITCDIIKRFDSQINYIEGDDRIKNHTQKVYHIQHGNASII